MLFFTFYMNRPIYMHGAISERSAVSGAFLVPQHSFLAAVPHEGHIIAWKFGNIWWFNVLVNVVINVNNCFIEGSRDKSFIGCGTNCNDTSVKSFVLMTSLQKAVFCGLSRKSNRPKIYKALVIMALKVRVWFIYGSWTNQLIITKNDTLDNGTNAYHAWLLACCIHVSAAGISQNAVSASYSERSARGEIAKIELVQKIRRLRRGRQSRPSNEEVKNERRQQDRPDDEVRRS